MSFKTTIRDGVRSVLRSTTAKFMRRIHHSAHRIEPRLRRVEKSKLVVFAPHMDDEMIGCGGTLALHAECGSDVEIVFTSDSAGSSTSSEARHREMTIRSKEAQAAIDFLGFPAARILGYPDGSLSMKEGAMADDMRQLIEAAQPDQVFCPFVSDMHRDHQATAAALGQALATTKWEGEVWGYEVWSTLWPNVAVDISEVAERKREAIRLYETQVDHIDYEAGALGLNQYRGLQVSVAYAEAFYVCRRKDFVELAECLGK